MDKFSYNSYPDSADSSPRSREIEFDNPQPWEDNQQQPQTQSYKVKFMCSYGGKIQPRTHDNQIAYVGGETKILSADRGIKFSAMVSKLSSIVGGDVTFKYQLPGEDLDALISVTNDDDLEHMMHEYDRLLRTSSKSARMRLFLFQTLSSAGGFGSEGSTKSDRDRFVEALNSVRSIGESEKSVTAPPNNADFLFGSDKGVAPPPPVAVKLREAVTETVALEATIPGDQRLISPDHDVNQTEIQRQILEFQRMQIRDQEQQQQLQHQQQHQQHVMHQQQQQYLMLQQRRQHLMQQLQQQEAMYMRKSEDGLMESGGYYPPTFTHNMPPSTETVQQQTNPQAPEGFWQGNPVPGGVFQGMIPGMNEQQVYMRQGPPPGTVYHTTPQDAARPMTTGQGGQGYYPNVQRMPPDAYREHPAYNMVQPHPQPPAGTQAAQPPFSSNISPYSTNVPPRPVPVGVDPAVYTQVAYEGGMGRQVYYTTAGGAMAAPPQQQPQYHGVGVPISGTGEQRSGQDGKVAMAMAAKGTQGSDST